MHNNNVKTDLPIPGTPCMTPVLRQFTYTPGTASIHDNKCTHVQIGTVAVGVGT